MELTFQKNIYKILVDIVTYKILLQKREEQIRHSFLILNKYLFIYLKTLK